MNLMRWTGWVILILGVWVLVSPWVAPFLGISAVWNGIFAGILIVIAALWGLFGEKPPGNTEV